MAAPRGTVDGLGFEEVNQSVTFTEIISGSDLFAAGSATAGRVIADVHVSGKNIYAQTGVVSATLSGTNVYAQTAVQGVNVIGTTLVSGKDIYSQQTVIAGTSVSGKNIYGGTSVESATVSGTNVYAQTLIRAPTLQGDTAISGKAIYSSSTIDALTNISGNNLYATATILGSEVKDAAGKVRSNTIGNPGVFGARVAAGSIALSAGSAAWAIFGVTFGAAPRVVATYENKANDAANAMVVGSNVSVGSVYLIGQTASEIVNWIAVGA